MARRQAAFRARRRCGSGADGETLKVGDLEVTAHLTPGHTPGSTTWTWRSCEGSHCLDVVYADSLNAVAAPGFRFTGGGTHPSLEPSFRRSIATVGGLPCDILLAVHPSFADLAGKLRRRQEQPASEPFVDPAGCRAYAEGAAKRLDQRVAENGKAPAPHDLRPTPPESAEGGDR